MEVVNRQYLPTRWGRVYSVGMADFTREELEAKVAAGESLEGADLREATLREVKLPRALLSRANLYGANLKGAGYNADTKWPDEDFDPVAKGAVNEPSGRSMNRWLANG